MQSSLSLDSLISPVPDAVFYGRHWEAKPLHVARHEPNYFHSTFSLEDADQVLSKQVLHYPAARLVKMGQPIETSQYTTADGRIDVTRVWQLFADGTTVILDQMQRRVASLAALCRAMESQFSFPFQTNIYLTPPNARGFAAHYDTHDVFILQSSGSKLWRLFETPIELPLRGQQHNAANTPKGKITLEVELQAGDTLYVPRGLIHEASSTDSTSLHVTLGVSCYTWADLLLEAMASGCLADSAFRKSLPRGFAREQFDRAELRNECKKLALKLAASADFDAALDAIVNDFVSSRSPNLEGQARYVNELDRLTGTSVVGSRPNLIYRLRTVTPEVCLTCYGRDIRLPSHVYETLAAALASPRMRIDQWPGQLDLPGKIVLARRLIREGLLIVHDA